MTKLSPITLIILISHWILTIVGLNLGCIPLLHYNPLQMVLEKINMGYAFMPIHYVVGGAAIISLINLLAMHDSCRCD